MVKNYKVNDLRVGTLGLINYKSPEDVYWNKRKILPYIVFETVSDSRLCGVRKGKDIITEDSYYFFNEKVHRDAVLKLSNSNYAIYNNIPLGFFIDKQYIESWEIKKIVCNLNIDYALLTNNNDFMLLKLKESFDKLDKIDSYSRENIVDKLTFLTELYIGASAYCNEDLDEIRQNASLEILETYKDIEMLTKSTKENKKKIKHFTN